MTAFWILMLMIDLLIPFTMIAFGKMFLRIPPKNINSLFGYRTKMSMKNDDTWTFAHKYCGRLWYRMGLTSLPVSIVPILYVFGEEILSVAMVGLVVCGIQAILLLLTILPVENALKKTFDQNGVWKQA